MSNSSAYKYTIENIFNYDIPFRNQNHSLVLTGVIGYEHETSSSLGFGADNVPVDEFWWHMIADGENTSQSHSFGEYYILSYLLRAQYNFKDRYIVNFSFRSDGSSRFPKSSRYGYFPAGSFAWIITNEEFMPKNDILTELKLRLSAGQTGSMAGISNWAAMTLISAGTPYNGESGMRLTQTAQNVKWENHHRVHHPRQQHRLSLQYGSGIQCQRKGDRHRLQMGPFREYLLEQERTYIPSR